MVRDAIGDNDSYTTGSASIIIDRVLDGEVLKY
jgi:hypothetical protein